jgi:chemotaxis protein MotB
MLVASRSRRTLDIWPGFVDALAALLMVVIFVLLLFSLGQFLLNDALVGRDAALSRLHAQLNNISGLLAQTRIDKDQLEQRLQGVSSELQASVTERDELQTQLAVLNAQAHEAELALAALRLELDSSRKKLTDQEQLAAQQTQQIQTLEDTRTQLQGEREQLQGEREQLQDELQASRTHTQQVQAKSEDLARQLAELNGQIARLSNALEVSEANLKDKTLEVENLGARLNEALVNKVEELAAYRSEFFGKLHEALKNNPDVRIEGDRFLLPSEVLFPSASAELDENGQREIAKVAHSLKEIMAKIPQDMEWVLRVDGHTDKRPIRVAFASNWELSSARATSIVKDLIAEGIPPEHLVAAGFAQYHPLDPADTPEAYRRNRRIELKLTSR